MSNQPHSNINNSNSINSLENNRLPTPRSEPNGAIILNEPDIRGLDNDDQKHINGIKNEMTNSMLQLFEYIRRVSIKGELIDPTYWDRNVTTDQALRNNKRRVRELKAKIQDQEDTIEAILHQLVVDKIELALKESNIRRQEIRVVQLSEEREEKMGFSIVRSTGHTLAQTARAKHLQARSEILGNVRATNRTARIPKLNLDIVPQAGRPKNSSSDMDMSR